MAKPEVIERFKEIAESAGYSVTPYSGRGMFGRECLSISSTEDGEDVTSTKVIYDLMSCISSELEESAFYQGTPQAIPDEIYNEERELLLKVQSNLARTATDSLGYGSVIYWPNLSLSNKDRD